MNDLPLLSLIIVLSISLAACDKSEQTGTEPLPLKPSTNSSVTQPKSPLFAPPPPPVNTDPVTLQQNAGLSKEEIILAEIKSRQGRVTISSPESEQPIYHINLTGASVNDIELARWCKLGKIERLVLERTAISDAALEHLKSLPLKALFLNSTKISDIGLEHLKETASLSHLSLHKTQVTDAGLQHLRGLNKLQRLFLNDTKVQDQGIKNLSGLTLLKELNLSGTKVTSKCLQDLAPLKNLRHLDLSSTFVDDSAVEPLQAMSHLTELHLRHTKVSVAGATKLQDASLDLTLYHSQ